MAASGRSKVLFRGGPMDGHKQLRSTIPFYHRDNVIIAATAFVGYGYKLTEELDNGDCVFTHYGVTRTRLDEDATYEEQAAYAEEVCAARSADIFIFGTAPEDLKKGQPEYWELLSDNREYDETKTCRDLGPRKLPKRKRRGQRPDYDIWDDLDENEGRLV